MQNPSAHPNTQALVNVLFKLSSPLWLSIFAALAAVTAIGDKVLFASYEEWFHGQAALGHIAYDLSIAYLGAYSFYLIVVFAPDKRKAELAKPAIALRTTAIIHECRQFFLLINQESSCKQDIEKLDRDAISKLFDGLDLTKPSPKFRGFDQSGKYIWCSWSQFFNSLEEETRRLVTELELMSSFYDAELIALIDRIGNCEFFRNITPQIMIDEGTLKVLSSSVFDYYSKVRDLRAYASDHGYITKWHKDLTPAYTMVEPPYPVPEDIGADDIGRN